MAAKHDAVLAASNAVGMNEDVCRTLVAAVSTVIVIEQAGTQQIFDYLAPLRTTKTRCHG